MARPIHATVSAAALRHNYVTAQRAAPHARAYAVVKANAYGHGLPRVARALGAAADGFATLELDGAVALRQIYHGPILLLEGFFEPSELRAIAEHELAFAVHHEEQLKVLQGLPHTRSLDVFFKVNTGMNRLGFRYDVARAALERLERMQVTRSITLMTHFATADGPQGVVDAMRRFNDFARGLDYPRSLSNSAAVFSHPKAHGNIVRPGIVLYGATPFADRTSESLGLKPAMCLQSELIAIQELADGESVGYGSEFVANGPMRLGVVACGYADGYPRHAKSGTPIVVGGVRTRTAGRVSMDMLTVDLTPVPEARLGTTVTLWGGDGLSIDEVAASAGTVGYELMCAVAPRVPILDA
ncbi:MAG TPA: alanine racemase [Usitatibacter sp.]|nr:alanine racemase [Usitatibacter sp.]